MGIVVGVVVVVYVLVHITECQVNRIRIRAVLAFQWSTYSDNPSSNPTGVNSFYSLKFV